MCIRDRSTWGKIFFVLNTLTMIHPQPPKAFLCTFPCCCCKMSASETVKVILIIDLVTAIFFLFGGFFFVYLPYIIVASITLYQIQNNQMTWTKKWCPIARYISWGVKTGILTINFIVAILGLELSRSDDILYNIEFVMLIMVCLFVLPICIIQLFICRIFMNAMKETGQEFAQFNNVVVGMPIQMVPVGYPQQSVYPGQVQYAPSMPEVYPAVPIGQPLPMPMDSTPVPQNQ
eukprot:TRINITY_DN1444_c0_g1_i1.p1 TRINITY_DN1444_c0_g1~~TRINITY_DN1444_c0_g1_i1.p1  ORF type:complete len:233 (+),score=43.67 TRINITY_DN1444_c0_g1_i1:66-764(+)